MWIYGTDPNIPIPVVDEDGEPTGELVEGFHVNVIPALMHEGLEPYRVTPSPLRRVFAGDDAVNPVLTVPLKFPDEETAKAAGLWVEDESQVGE